MVDARIEAGEQGWRFYSGLHRLMLRISGRVPDDWLTDIRRMLAGGDLVQVPDTVAGSMVEFAVPLTVGEVALLREMVRVFFGDRDPVGIDQVAISEQTPATGHRFFPVPAGVLATDAARIPPLLDLTGRPTDSLLDLPAELSELADISMRLTDVRDQAQVSVLRDAEDVLSTARAWRFPADRGLADGVRVVLVEVTAFAAAWDIGGRVQRSLARHGEADPQVEVYWSGEELPPYHRAALAGAALLWQAPGGRVPVGQPPNHG
jgi:hypothetical protein